MELNCYLCDYPGDNLLNLKKTFTAHQLCRNPNSSYMCDRCNDLMNSKYQFAYYKDKSVFTRCTSWLLVKPRDLTDKRNRPYFGDLKEYKGKQMYELCNYPSRADIAKFLIEPPQPPFEVAIAESGQKHILYLAETALSRYSFNIAFEETIVYIDDRWRRLYGIVESLFLKGISKQEILTGEYFMKSMLKWEQNISIAESQLAPVRKTRAFQLATFLLVKSSK